MSELTKQCSFPWFNQCPVLPVLIKRWSWLVFTQISSSHLSYLKITTLSYKKQHNLYLKRQWLFLTLSGNWGSRENWYFIYVLESTTGTNNFLLSKSKIRLKFLIKILTYYAFMKQDKVYIPPKFQTFSAKLHGSKKGMCKTLWVVNLTFLLKFMYFSLCYTKYIVYLCSSVPASYP